MAFVDDNNVKVCRGWILVGVHALGISGILSILIVFLRMPFLKSIITNADRVFDLSLVIHVDLSVIVWLCSISSALVSMAVHRESKYLAHSWTISAVGTVLMVLSALFKDATPVKSNYIPVIDNWVFFTGLGLFFCGVLLNTLPWKVKRQGQHTDVPLLVGIHGMSAMMTAVAFCFITAYSVTSKNLESLVFYERVFWGAGHLLQGVFGQAFLVVVLLKIRNGRFTHPYLVSAVFVINALSVIVASASHVIYPSDFASLATFFTWHMRIAEAVVPLFLFVFAIGNMRPLFQRDNRHLLYSSAMFTYGSILGILSMHGTVTIPAHYHGCVVGITAAFMGFVYLNMPQLGYREVSQVWRNIQLCVYSVGQALHITGLELLGGYGALRKVTYLPDAASALARYCFSIGGAMAILGGFLFVLLVLVCVYRGRKTEYGT
ncbi:cbb3-type cytochrome c oxidase subunit I [Anaplasma capra]|uniref:cbb3-type cytochrome c oxidase subunit I n=1 Tax=Anaplasma capra TaxID=1562740 RepID=UPI0021D5C759|nr:cbb3-type cytochrome c oxidase subunit I [Anaplasma capra]MCU7611322.1 cbb3-type cytochrome c oxidase subunit I [Anaplasma capra]MCU7612812.1 cbb3-type cytochrome c oxidase subunit I [Anaplasma capra]